MLTTCSRQSSGATNIHHHRTPHPFMLAPTSTTVKLEEAGAVVLLAATRACVAYMPQDGACVRVCSRCQRQHHKLPAAAAAFIVMPQAISLPQPTTARGWGLSLSLCVSGGMCACHRPPASAAASVFGCKCTYGRSNKSPRPGSNWRYWIQSPV